MSGDKSFGVRPDETHGELAMPLSLPQESRAGGLRQPQGYVMRGSDFIAEQTQEANRGGPVNNFSPLGGSLAEGRRAVADHLSLLLYVLGREATNNRLPDDRFRSLVKLLEQFNKGWMTVRGTFDSLSRSARFGLLGADWAEVNGCSLYVRLFQAHSDAFEKRSNEALNSLLFGDRELGLVGLSNARSEFSDGCQQNSVFVMSHVETFVKRWTTLLKHFTESVESSVTGAKCSESALRLLLPLASQPDAHDDVGKRASLVQGMIRVVFDRLGPWGYDPLAHVGPVEPARFQNEVVMMRPIVKEMVRIIQSNAPKSGARSSNPETNRDASERLCALESEFRSQFEQSS